MTTALQEGPRAKTRVAFGISLPWLVYVAVLTIISVAERRATPEAVGMDWILDATINWVSLIGLIAAAAWSGFAMRDGHRSTHRGALLAFVVAGGFIGPLLATIVVTAIAHDVDGSQWMLFSPVLGLLVVVLTLFILWALEMRRRRMAG